MRNPASLSWATRLGPDCQVSQATKESDKMSFLADKLRALRADMPPRVLIYGPPGMGKTTLASEFPNPVFIQVEDGTPAGLDLVGMQAASFDDVMDGIRAIYEEEHEFQTLVIDSLDKMQPLLWDAVCRDNKWDSIETPGYGKGYVATEYRWRELLDGLQALRRDRRMNIVLISHSDVERFDDPRTASYSQYAIRLHKSGRKLVEDEVDAILLLNYEATVKEEDQGFNKKRAHAEGGSQRFIYTEGRPAYTAKNRYGMPPKIVYRAGQGYAELSKYFPQQASE